MILSINFYPAGYTKKILDRLIRAEINQINKRGYLDR